jgi:uncharacterized phage protein (TIGR01671 family)
MIKFRAWDTHEEVMNRVDYIDFAHGVIGMFNENSRGYEQPTHRVKLMQSSGYKDKNGVEIFIDDLVADEYGRVYRVVFKGDSIRGDAVKPEHKNRWLSSFLEVIGNIHENPEMIK